MKKIILLFTACASSFVLSAQAPRNVLLEIYTYPGTGHGPRGHTLLVDVLNAHPINAIGISNHQGSPMGNSYSNAMNNAFPGSYSYATVDRYKFSNSVAMSTTQGMSNVANRLAVSAPLNVLISSTYNSTSRTVNATVTASFVAAASGDMRISCILVEDSVTGTSAAGYDQKNAMGQGCQAPDPTSPWYNFPCVLVGFKHRYVARKNLASDNWGTPSVIPASVTAGGTYSQTYSYTLPSTWNSNKMSIVAFVSYYDTDVNLRSVLNANEVKLGGSTPSTTAIIEPANGNQIEVKQNTPNPFSDITAIQFQLNNTDNVIVKVYDIYGKEVNTLINTKLVPGEHTFYWAGDDHNGNTVAGGVYYYTISTSSQSITKPMIFISQ